MCVYVCVSVCVCDRVRDISAREGTVQLKLTMTQQDDIINMRHVNTITLPCMHTRTYAHTYARTHTHTHTQKRLLNAYLREQLVCPAANNKHGLSFSIGQTFI